MIPLPSFPTDNLYKFVFVSGIILFIYSTYFAATYEFELNVKSDELKIDQKALEEDSIIRSKEGKTKIYTPERIKFEKEVAKLQIEVANLPRYGRLFGYLIAIGAAMTGFGWFFWSHKIQQHQDTILKFDAEKYIEAKKLKINELQNEKEFEVYNQIWDSVLYLKLATKPFLAEELGKKRLQSFYSKYEKFDFIIEKYRPFYSDRIYKLLDDIRKNLFYDTSEIDEHLIQKYKEEFSKKIHKSYSSIEQVAELIRDRIEIKKNEPDVLPLKSPGFFGKIFNKIKS